MMTLVSSRYTAMSAGGECREALVVFSPQLLHTLGGPLLEIGVIPVFPRPGGGFEGLDLPQAHQFFLRGPREKRATAPFADQNVNLGNELLGDDDMGAPGVHRRGIAHGSGRSLGPLIV